MIELMIADELESLVDSAALEKAVVLTLSHEEVTDEIEMTVVVDYDERLQELNRQFLGVDAPTDVLSFPAGEINPETGMTYLGDIIISYPTALKQAEQAGASLTAEMQLLVIHGTLHLLGYDHGSPDEKAEMWAVQQEILDAGSIQISKLPE